MIQKKFSELAIGTSFTNSYNGAGDPSLYYKKIVTQNKRGNKPRKVNTESFGRYLWTKPKSLVWVPA